MTAENPKSNKKPAFKASSKKLLAPITSDKPVDDDDLSSVPALHIGSKIQSMYHDKRALQDIIHATDISPIKSELDVWFRFKQKASRGLNFHIARRTSFVTVADFYSFLQFIFCERKIVSEREFKNQLEQVYLTYETHELNPFSICRPLLPSEHARMLTIAQLMGIVNFSKDAEIIDDNGRMRGLIEQLERDYHADGIPLTKVTSGLSRKYETGDKVDTGKTRNIEEFLEDLFGEDDLNKDMIDSVEDTDNDYISVTKGRQKGASLVVVREIPSQGNSSAQRKIKADFGPLEGKALPHALPVDFQVARLRLMDDYPYASALIDRLLQKPARLSTANRFVIKPTLIVGKPGSGKTTFAKRFFEVMGFSGKHGSKTVNMGGIQDDHILGVSQGWATAMPSLLIKVLMDQKICNPAFVIDELDKSSLRSKNASFMDRLLPILEPSENTVWMETYLGTEIDISQVNWIFTANDLSSIPDFLLSRLDVVEMPVPTEADIPRTVQALLVELLEEAELDAEWMPKLSILEIEALQENWRTHYNLRILKKQVEFLYAEHSRKIMLNRN